MTSLLPRSGARRRPAGHVLSVLALAALLAACGDRGADAVAPKASAAASAPRAAGGSGAGVVTPPESLAARLKVEPVTRRPVVEPMSVVGRIDFDEQSVSRIGASVTGRITELDVAVGQTVRAGQVLATLHSTELGNAQLSLLKATAQRELAVKAADRARQLLAADVIGSAELQRRDSELKVAEAEQRAAVDQLRVMGMSQSAVARTIETGAITSTSPVVATVSGTIVERRVNRGQVVQPADVMFIVADLSRVWVVAQVPEAQISRVRPGLPVRIEVTGASEPLRGRVAWIADTVNPETRTVTVRTEVGNPARELKPAMLANVTIEPAPVERLVVPTSAVVRESNLDHVFVKQPDGRYRLTRVTLADETGGLRPVISGLEPGVEVVADGAFHLNNERKRAELEGS
jgi:cobalt-zinc-cadmium efflux system membrane fusion protein